MFHTGVVHHIHHHLPQLLSHVMIVFIVLVVGRGDGGCVGRKDNSTTQHLVVLVLPPPSYQHLSELVVLYAVALLGVVVVLLHGTVVVVRRCELQRLDVFGRRLHPAENTSPVWVWTRSPIAVVEVVVVVSPMLVVWVVVGKWMSSSSASGWVGGMLSEQPVGVVVVTSRLPSDVVLVAVDSCLSSNQQQQR